MILNKLVAVTRLTSIDFNR